MGEKHADSQVNRSFIINLSRVRISPNASQMNRCHSMAWNTACIQSIFYKCLQKLFSQAVYSAHWQTASQWRTCSMPSITIPNRENCWIKKNSGKVFNVSFFIKKCCALWSNRADRFLAQRACGTVVDLVPVPTWHQVSNMPQHNFVQVFLKKEIT